MDLSGKIIQMLPLQSGIGKVSGKEWKVQSFVIETQEQYPRKVCFELFGEDRIKANPCNVDDVVTVSFDIESREFNGRWFTSLRAWRIQQGVVTSNDATSTTSVPPASVTPPTNTATFDANAGDETDLPF